MASIFRSVLLAAVAICAPAGSAGTITWTAAPFNDVNQLSSDGVLVDAAHFGADTEADVNANGITFVSRDGSSPHLTIGENGGTPYYDADLYQPSIHSTGYTDVIGMSPADQDLMFDSVAYGPGYGNSLVTLKGLTVGSTYQIQILAVDDRAGAQPNCWVSGVTSPPFYGPYPWSNNAVQLITGVFTADATTQEFRFYVQADDNAQINAYQLRAIIVPSGYASWASANAPGQNMQKDHDSDGVANGVEYFMGEIGNSFTSNPVPDAERNVSWPMSATYAGTYGTDYTVQTSIDLVDWDDVPSSEITSLNPLVYKIPPGDSPRFARLKVFGP